MRGSGTVRFLDVRPTFDCREPMKFVVCHALQHATGRDGRTARRYGRPYDVGLGPAEKGGGHPVRHIPTMHGACRATLILYTELNAPPFILMSRRQHGRTAGGARGTTGRETNRCLLSTDQTGRRMSLASWGDGGRSGGRAGGRLPRVPRHHRHGTRPARGRSKQSVRTLIDPGDPPPRPIRRINLSIIAQTSYSGLRGVSRFLVSSVRATLHRAPTGAEPLTRYMRELVHRGTLSRHISASGITLRVYIS